MKKVISAVLAAAMTLSMAVTAFARPSDINKDPYVSEDSKMYIYDKDLRTYVESDGGDQEYGTKFAVEINFNGNRDSAEYTNAIGKYRAFFNIKEGENIVKNVGISTIRATTFRYYVTKGTPIEKVGGNTYYRSAMYGINDFPRELGKYISDKYKGWNVKLAVAYNGTALGDAKADWSDVSADNLLSTMKPNSNGVYTGYAPTYTDLKNGAAAGKTFSVIMASTTTGMPFDVLPEPAEIIKHNNPNLDVNSDEFAKKVIGYENSLKSTMSEIMKKEIASRKVSGRDTYKAVPCVVVELVDSLGKDNKDVAGFITLARNNSDVNDNLNDKNLRKFVNFNTAINPDRQNCTGGEEEFVFSIERKDSKGRIYKEDKAEYFINTEGVKWFDSKFNCDINHKILDMTDKGDFDFFNWPAKPDFNNMGTLTLYTEIENPNVYVITDNGGLRKLHCNWEKDSGCVTIRTSGLRSYIVTNAELIKE